MSEMDAEGGYVHDHIAKLVRMANQIGDFFMSQNEDGRVAGIADHIGKFWDKKMRRDIYAHLAAGGEGLSPTVAEAIRFLRSHDKTAAPASV